MAAELEQESRRCGDDPDQEDDNSSKVLFPDRLLIGARPLAMTATDDNGYPKYTGHDCALWKERDASKNAWLLNELAADTGHWTHTRQPDRHGFCLGEWTDWDTSPDHRQDDRYRYQGLHITVPQDVAYVWLNVAVPGVVKEQEQGEQGGVAGEEQLDDDQADGPVTPVTTAKIRLHALKVPELKKALQERGLDSGGLKSELIDRLRGALLTKEPASGTASKGKRKRSTHGPPVSNVSRSTRLAAATDGGQGEGADQGADGNDDHDGEAEGKVNWACCDVCGKWRVLGGCELPGKDEAFYCNLVGKYCDDDYDEDMDQDLDQDESSEGTDDEDGQNGVHVCPGCQKACKSSSGLSRHIGYNMMRGECSCCHAEREAAADLWREYQVEYGLRIPALAGTTRA